MAGAYGLAALSRLFTGRLLGGMLAIHAVLLPLLFLGVIYIVKTGYETQFIDTARLQAGLLANQFARDIIKPGLQQDLENAVFSGNLLFAEIIARDGTVLASVNAEATRDFREDFYFGQHEDSVYHVAPFIYDDTGMPVATLRLGYDEKPAQDQIAFAYRRGFEIAAAYIVLTLLLVIFWERVLKLMRRELVAQAHLLEHQAQHDALTGMPNRVLLRDRLQQAIELGKKKGTSFALLLMDLDRFKEINDVLGHHTGDVVLQQVSARLRELMRDTDIAARLGGDEFAMLIESADRARATAVSEQAVRAMERPFEVDSRTLHISASIGAALFPDHGETAQDLLRHADVAMYNAKKSLQRRMVYRGDMDQDSLKVLELTEELRAGIEQQQILVYFQPKVDLRTSQLAGVEALVRWQHPRFGIMQPQHFIGLAENTGLVGWLMQEVLRQVLKHRATLNGGGHELSISVNLSPSNLQNQDLPERIADVVGDLRAASSYLALELTENAIFADPKSAEQILEQLNAKGIRLSIDDFGTGYSSLAYIQKLPISEIKIDKSFVINMTRSRSDAAIVRATIDLAHDLGLNVVAEGVEQEQSLDLLRTLGCDVAQGYYIAHPLPILEFQEWMTHSSWGVPKVG